jgi:hypothetical protein
LQNLTTSLKFGIIDPLHYNKYLNLLIDISMQQDSINDHLKNVKTSQDFFDHFSVAKNCTNLIYLNGSYSYYNLISPAEKLIVNISNVYNLSDFFKQVYIKKYDCETRLLKLGNDLKLRNNKTFSSSEEFNGNK